TIRRAQRRLSAGQEVDVRAPDGRLTPYRPHPEDMAPLTAHAIADGVETLFQAAFAIDDLLVKVDVLQKTATSTKLSTSVGWHLIEVKSSAKYKPKEHLPDVAFQVYVLRQAGLNIAQASLMHLNSDCRAPDLSNLFTLTDITDEANDFLPQLETDVAAIRQLMAGNDAPDVGIGRHCTRPYTCLFYDHCWHDVAGLTIYDIPRLNAKKERPLQDAGVLYLADIPADYPLTATQRAFVNFIVQEQINVDRAAIQQELDDLEYPLYFFDFETIDYAIPRFDGCKPYQQVPFQYSCHILQADGTLTHYDYLHTDRDNPQRPLAEALLTHIGETGRLIAYNIPFERGVLRHLAAQFPEYADRLTSMADRLWDQLPIFRRHYRDYRFGKSNSLKSVLPVMAPELSYKLLDVQNGTQAQAVWEEMIGEGDTAVKAQLADQLRAYCHLDTLAMVEIHRMLVALSENDK
ncbi:MAG: DUF2779 domain-containing protein, partial [Anaerolineae bacterium]